VAVKRGCDECLTEGYQRDGTPMGRVSGFVPRELDGRVDWQPCFGCNRERWSAWQAGELSPATSPEVEEAPHERTGPTREQAAVMAAAFQPPPVVIGDNESVHERARKRAALDKLRARYPDPDQPELPFDDPQFES
jgi:hypothetical protein